MSEGIIKYSMSNVLIPSNYRPSKKSAIKLNRSLDNNEKILFNLPQKIALPNKIYSPHKISLALSARLKNANQNLNKYRIQIVNKSADKILLFPEQNNIAIEANYGTPKLGGLLQQKIHQINNRKNKKLLLHIGKNKKRYSTEHTQPQIQTQKRIFNKSICNYKQQNIRQYLKMSTIREFFSYIDGAKKSKKIKDNLSLPKLQIQNASNQKQKKTIKFLNIQSKQQNQSKQIIQQNNKLDQKVIMCKLKVQKNLKIKPSQIITSRIQNSASKLSMLSTYLQSSINYKEIDNKINEQIIGWDQKLDQETIDFTNMEQKQKKCLQKIIIKAKLNRYKSEQNQLDRLDLNQQQLLYKSQHKYRK